MGHGAVCDKKFLTRKQKLIVIVGPTASGKSALAVKLAKQFDGEIISADSRQIYRGLDIGSGKVTGAWRHAPVIPADAGIQNIKRGHAGFPIESGMTKQKNKKVFIYQGVPHHCIDFVSPRRAFTAAQFVAAARRATSDITRRGKTPIIAGGTAFWIDALVYSFSLPEVKPDARLRRALEKKSPAALFALLQKLDPRRAAGIEQKNPRRLIRAIEIARSLGRVPHLVKHSMFDTLWIGLNPSYEVQPHKMWERRVLRRADAMIRQGLMLETKKLLAAGLARRRIGEFGFEYRAALDFLDGRITRAAFRERLVRDTLRYAKQQSRWWKRNPDIRWMRNGREAAAAVKTFLQKSP